MRDKGIVTQVMKSVFLWIWTLLTVKGVKVTYDFQGPFSSGNTVFRAAAKGPLPRVFSVCTSTSECSIIDFNHEKNVLWSTNSAASPYAFSSQTLRKTLITGFPTTLLDFSKIADPEKPSDTKSLIQSRPTMPKVIIHCVFTLGDYWICISGSGSYFLFNVRDEIVVNTYKNDGGGLLSHVTNSKCAIVNGNFWLFCVDLNGEKNKIMNLLSPDDGFINYREFYNKYQNPNPPSSSSISGSSSGSGSGSVSSPQMLTSSSSSASSGSVVVSSSSSSSASVSSSSSSSSSIVQPQGGLSFPDNATGVSTHGDLISVGHQAKIKQ